MVAAPTGSGKTAVAEVAAVLALGSGKRVIYTTPLKALSNQKLRELQGRFGEDRVGLVTGDVQYQPRAEIVVMTTEVLRNILYSQGGRGGRRGRLRLRRVAGARMRKKQTTGFRTCSSSCLTRSTTSGTRTGAACGRKA